jgi:replication initiation protein RepC
MEHIATTPFGRRPLSLAMVAAQQAAKTCPEDAAAHKWRVFRNLTEAKEGLGLSDRALAVLGALLTFHPETALTPGTDLVVFPSNRELSMRAHGPAAATLRRALAQLVETGIVIRRDSPNGKRYARRGQGGQVEQAFGFDLSPLVARAAEFERLADAVRAETRARMLLREEISLHRRDIAKTIAIGIEEELLGPWQAFGEHLRRLGGMPPRSADRSQLEAIAIELRALRLDVDKCLSENLKSEDSNVNESQSERHQQNSNTETPIESELGFQGSQGQLAAPDTETKRPPQRAFPLGMVLEACPDIADYSRHGITSWRDFMATAGVVRSMLGISPSAWAAACDAMGEEGAAIMVAAILQKGEGIKSPGGYLRNLTERAKAGQFSLGPVLMALLRAKTGDGARKKRA